MDEFRKQVKIALIERGKNQEWLCEQIRSRTGLFMDSAYLSNILAGRAKSQPVVNAIKEILELKEE